MTDTSSQTANEPPVVGRLTTPTVIAVQLGALVTILLWVFYGWPLGVPALFISLACLRRAWQTGFVLDHDGLLIRTFLPGGPGVVPWPKLISVDVDTVVVGTETRSRKPRLRFFVDGVGPTQIIGCNEAAIQAVLERFRTRGLQALDSRKPRRTR